MTEAHAARLTANDVDVIIEGIEEFIMNGDPDVDDIWKLYIRKLKALRAALVNADQLSRLGEATGATPWT